MISSTRIKGRTFTDRHTESEANDVVVLDTRDDAVGNAHTVLLRMPSGTVEWMDYESFDDAYVKLPPIIRPPRRGQQDRKHAD